MQVSQGKTCYFHLVRAGFTGKVPDEIWGVDVHGHLSRLTCLISNSYSSRPRFVYGFLQTLPRDNALALDSLIPFHHGSLGTFIPATRHA